MKTSIKLSIVVLNKDKKAMRKESVIAGVEGSFRQHFQSSN